MNYPALIGIDCPPGQIYQLFLHRCMPDPNYHPNVTPGGGGIVVIDPGPVTNPNINVSPDGGYTPLPGTDTSIMGIPPLGWVVGLGLLFFLLKN